MGIWFGRKGTRLVVMTALAKPTANMVVSPAGPDGRVVVRGTAPADTEAVLALVNQGEAGVTKCEADLATALPLFSFTCPMVEGDQTAWLEVAARPQGR